MPTPRSQRKAVIIYTRVSTENQHKQGIGIAAQRAGIDAHMRDHDLHAEAEYEEAASGGLPHNHKHRPELMKAIAHAKRLRVPIIVYGLDRMSRHTEELESLLKQESVEVLSASEGGILTVSSLKARAARAEHERKEGSRRTKEALALRKADGVVLGNQTNLPEAQAKGASSNAEAAKNKIAEIADALEQWAPDEDDTLAEPDALRARKVADLLNDLGIKTRTGKTWSVPALRRPLKEAKQLIEQRREDRLETELANDPTYGNW